MTRGRYPDQTVEVVVEPEPGSDGASRRHPVRRRPRHPWRWTVGTVCVVALAAGAAAAVTQWQRLGHDVEIIDAGTGWTSGVALTCSGGARVVIYQAERDGSGTGLTHLDDDPQDIVTLTNRGDRAVTLRLADDTMGAFEPGAVRRATEPVPVSLRTVDHVTVPAGASARLRLVVPELTVHGDANSVGTASRSAVTLRVTSLGVTTTAVVRLSERIIAWATPASANAATSTDTGAPWSVDDLCA